VSELHLTQLPSAKTGMLIRRPAADVFEAFVDPAITGKFWFTKGSARLQPGREVVWTWEMYGMSITVAVKAVEPNRRILVEWPAYGSPSQVEWLFTDCGDGTTFVSITDSGFTGNGDQVVEYAKSSTEGFTLVLAGVKALLEHNIQLNLVGDRFPQGIEAT
jgi:uncharacterized protein YndB with AHSA1/START domain